MANRTNQCAWDVCGEGTNKQKNKYKLILLFDCCRNSFCMGISKLRVGIIIITLRISVYSTELLFIRPHRLNYELRWFFLYLIFNCFRFLIFFFVLMFSTLYCGTMVGFNSTGSSLLDLGTIYCWSFFIMPSVFKDILRRKLHKQKL